MKKINYISFLIILILSLSLSVFAENKDVEGKHKTPPMQKTVLDPAQSLIDINQITCWVGSDGYHDWIVGGSWNGAYPNGVSFGPIFSEGIIWGGKVNDGTSPSVRVNGNTYGSGCAPVTRLYRVRTDYATGDLTQDAADFFDKDVSAVTSSDIDELKAQYAKDWNEWPADEGAPYDDVDENGQYNPSVDIPGIPGASQTLFIKYNDDQTPLYGSPAIGLEVSETYWAYAVSGALGNVIFKKVDIVYVGTPSTPTTATIDSMYIVQWADPDVGNSGDDFAGCDTVLNLGYAYNSGPVDATYLTKNLAPPAAGYDFLQGVSQYTGDPSDSAIFNLKWRHGYAYVNPKPMSSYAYFAAGGTWSDPAFTYTGTLEFYNLMRGFKPDPPYPAGDAFPSSVADVTPYGTYLLAGDPVFNTGKLDGSVDAPGDRRIMVTNGPITMSYGDTAQIVLALVGGLGQNYLSSVSVMKYNDAFAQYAYDQLFDIPIMPKPSVQAVGLNNQIVLNWGQNDSLVNAIENEGHGPYTFEAYSVYQLPPGGTDITAGKRIATYDVVNNVQVLFDKVLDENTGLIYSKPIVFLNNADGIQRYLSITDDQIFNKPLANGLSYTFAVTAIAYSNDPSLPSNILESSPTIVNVTPQMPSPGTRYSEAFGDTIQGVVHTSGTSDGHLYPIVVDPTQLTGMEYTLSFDTLTINGELTTVWNVKRSDGVMVVKNATNQDANQESPIADGIQFRVIGAPLDFKAFDLLANGDGPVSETVGYDITKAPTDVNGYSFDWYRDVLQGDASILNLDEMMVGGGFYFAVAGSGSITSHEAAIGRWTRDGARWSRIIPNNYEIRWTGSPSQPAGKGWMAFSTGTLVDVPFELWYLGPNLDDPSDDIRMMPWLFDENENDVFDFYLDHQASGGDNDPYCDWIYFMMPSDTAQPGEASYYAAVARSNPDYGGDYEVEHIARFSLMNWNQYQDGGLENAWPDPGSIFRIRSNIPNKAGDDVFTFTAPTKQTSSANAKEDVKNINVFPNPYYGYQYRETSRELHYVTFSHLPQNATIRIFDLSGVLVRTINHNSTSANSQFERWDLQNDSGYPVASGIYVIYIDMPSLGTTKILKLAVIQEQQILRVY